MRHRQLNWLFGRYRDLIVEGRHHQFERIGDADHGGGHLSVDDDVGAGFLGLLLLLQLLVWLVGLELDEGRGFWLHY